MAKVSIFLSTSIFFLLLFQEESIYSQNVQETILKKVVIDPGHGGKDTGAPGLKSKEKDIVLGISLSLGKMIQEKYPDVEVIYTRKTDKYLELHERSSIANKAHADLFISIHVNSVAKGSKCPSGAETYVMGNAKSSANMEVAKRENSVIFLEDDYTTRYEGFDPNKPELSIILSLMQNSYLHQSIEFATEIQNHFNLAKRGDRSVKQAPFQLLWQTSMPSVLIEAGFICNAEEEKFLSSEAGKEKLATSIFQAFCIYKTRFDERSSYRPDDESSEKTNNTPSKPQTATNQTNPAEPQKPNVVTKPEPQKPKVEFCIQIASRSIPVETNSNIFKKYKNVERIQTAANNYKYIVHRTTDYNVAQETLKDVRKDFKDAFVVSIADGKILPVAEGMKLIH